MKIYVDRLLHTRGPYICHFPCYNVLTYTLKEKIQKQLIKCDVSVAKDIDTEKKCYLSKSNILGSTNMTHI